MPELALTAAARPARAAAARALLRLLLPAATAALLLALIEAWVAGGTAPASLPRPSQVLWLLVAERASLLQQLAVTVFVAGCGLLLALSAALGIGLVTHAVPRLEVTVLTAGAVLSSVPMIAIAPILSIWLGLGLATRVLITFAICLFPLLVAIVQGLRESREAEQELFTVLAASAWQRLRLLSLPSAVPLLFVGLKIAAPLAVLGALVGEWNGAETGLGVVMLNAMFGLQVQRLWATVAMACAVSMLAYGYIALLERPAGFDRGGAQPA